VSRPRKRDCLKHFYLYPDGRPTTRRRDRGKDEVFPSFSGWLSDIITAGPSPLVFSLIPFPFHPCVSLPLPPSYPVSRHCPFQPPRDCGANTARYRINFLSRGCRDFTLLERRHWGGPRRSQEPPCRCSALGGCRGLGVEGDESEIKPRRKLKRRTEGS